MGEMKDSGADDENQRQNDGCEFRSVTPQGTGDDDRHEVGQVVIGVDDDHGLHSGSSHSTRVALHVVGSRHERPHGPGGW
jgi:hypothetical protein